VEKGREYGCVDPHFSFQLHIADLLGSHMTISYPLHLNNISL